MALKTYIQYYNWSLHFTNIVSTVQPLFYQRILIVHLLFSKWQWWNMVKLFYHENIVHFPHNAAWKNIYATDFCWILVNGWEDCIKNGKYQDLLHNWHLLTFGHSLTGWRSYVFGRIKNRFNKFLCNTWYVQMNIIIYMWVIRTN